MNRRRDHGSARDGLPETAQNFDEALAATQGLMMVEFSDRRAVNRGAFRAGDTMFRGTASPERHFDEAGESLAHRNHNPESGGGYESDQEVAKQSTCPRSLRYPLQQERLCGG